MTKTEQEPTNFAASQITVQAQHRPPGAIRCYTIWDHELAELEALPAAGVQALAGLALTVLTMAVGLAYTTSAPWSQFWIATAWGSGFATAALWGWWGRAVRTRNRLVKRIRQDTPVNAPLPPPEEPPV